MRRAWVGVVPPGGQPTGLKFPCCALVCEPNAPNKKLVIQKSQMSWLSVQADWRSAPVKSAWAGHAITRHARMNTTFFICASLMTYQRAIYYMASSGAGKRRVVSPRDTRHASHTPHTGDAHARIDRVHNHRSQATTGSTTRRELRNRKTHADRYEHKVKSRNNKAT